MKNIHTLLRDIEHVISTDGWFDQQQSQDFGRELGTKLMGDFAVADKVPTLRLSQMGPKCPRQLWASIHSPSSQEPLPAQARIKFAFGHMIEALAISMAKAAGHEVTGEQDELVVDGVVGHRDCIIDGCLVDVKSAASPSFLKFKSGEIAQSDTFGYLDQLDGYLVGSAEDPLLRVKDRAYLWAIDKQLGKMCLYEHKHGPERSLRIHARIAEAKRIIGLDEPPACTCEVVKDGESGNYKLDVLASYNPYKFYCFPQLRVFLYSDGPRFLTKVVRRPKRRDGSLITEVDINGKVVYNNALDNRHAFSYA